MITNLQLQIKQKVYIFPNNFLIVSYNAYNTPSITLYNNIVKFLPKSYRRFQLHVTIFFRVTEPTSPEEVLNFHNKTY